MSGELPVFARLYVYPRLQGETLVAWELNKLFPISEPPVFTLKASRSGVGDWTDVVTVTDEYFAFDVVRRVYGKAPRLHYKIVMAHAGKSYESGVIQMGGNLSDHDWAVLRDVVRKEILRLAKFAGRCGYVFKRRRWGVPCSKCLDFDTGEPANSECPECLGTGFTGNGYFDPVLYRVADSAAKTPRHTKTDDSGAGVVEPDVIAVRGLNGPWLDTGDVWVDFDADKRYVVQSVTTVNFRTHPFLLDPIELRLAPATDIIYSLKRPDDDVGSS